MKIRRLHPPCARVERLHHGRHLICARQHDERNGRQPRLGAQCRAELGRVAVEHHQVRQDHTGHQSIVEDGEGLLAAAGRGDMAVAATRQEGRKRSADGFAVVDDQDRVTVLPFAGMGAHRRFLPAAFELAVFRSIAHARVVESAHARHASPRRTPSCHRRPPVRIVAPSPLRGACRPLSLFGISPPEAAIGKTPAFRVAWQWPSSASDSRRAALPHRHFQHGMLTEGARPCDAPARPPSRN